MIILQNNCSKEVNNIDIHLFLNTSFSYIIKIVIQQGSERYVSL